MDTLGETRITGLQGLLLMDSSSVPTLHFKYSLTVIYYYHMYIKQQTDIHRLKLMDGLVNKYRVVIIFVGKEKSFDVHNIRHL